MQLTHFRGAPVLVLKRMGNRAFSLGLIVLGNQEYNLCKAGRSETLKHEFGHLLQLLILGLTVYVGLFALPSFLFYWTGWVSRRYYCLPWEYTADLLGGAKRPACSAGRGALWSWVYFGVAVCISLLWRIWLVYLIFHNL